MLRSLQRGTEQTSVPTEATGEAQRRLVSPQASQHYQDNQRSISQRWIIGVRSKIPGTPWLLPLKPAKSLLAQGFRRSFLAAALIGEFLL